MNAKFDELATRFVMAIEKLADNPANADNFENYLSYCFDAWLQKYANSPEQITVELERFANMEVTR